MGRAWGLGGSLKLGAPGDRRRGSGGFGMWRVLVAGLCENCLGNGELLEGAP